MIFKVAFEQNTDPSSNDVVSVIGIAKGLASSLLGTNTKRVVQVENATGILMINGDIATLLITGSSIAKIVFTPRSGALKDTPFYYEEKGDIDYTPAVVGTGWLPQGLDDNGKPKYGLIPYTRNDIFPNTVGYRTSVIWDRENQACEFIGELSNYGNLHWCSPDGQHAVSWKGPETHSFRNIYISNAWEAFGEAIYIGGEIIAAPLYKKCEDCTTYSHNIILGASIPNGTAYCVTLHRNERGGGNHYCVYKYDGNWKLLGTVDISYDGLAWFADNTGYKFVHPQGSQIEISQDSESVSLKAAPAITKGTQTEEYNSGSMPSFYKDFSSPILYDFSRTDADEDGGFLDSTLLSLKMSVSQKISTSGSGGSDTTTDEFDVEAKVILDTGDYAWISGPDVLYVGAVYYVEGFNGTKCKINWSVPGGYEDPNGNGSFIRITDTTSCGMGTITATISGGGNDGVSISREVKYPSGVWVFKETVGTPTSYCNDYGMPFSTELYDPSGRYKKVVGWYAGYSCDSTPPSGNVSISGVDKDGNEHSFPDSKPATVTFGNTQCYFCGAGGRAASGGWGSCGVCGDCVACDVAYAVRYAHWYSVYEWVCP